MKIFAHFQKIANHTLAIFWLVKKKIANPPNQVRQRRLAKFFDYVKNVLTRSKKTKNTHLNFFFDYHAINIFLSHHQRFT